MKYDTENLVIVNSNIVAIVYVICAFVGAIVSMCANIPKWVWLFVVSAVVVALAQMLLCAFRYKREINMNGSEDSKA